MTSRLSIRLEPGEKIPDCLARVLRAVGVPEADLEMVSFVELSVMYAQLRKCSVLDVQGEAVPQERVA